MAKVKMLTAYYLLAHKRRQEWANWKWRIFAILVVAVAMISVYEYLSANYYATAEFTRSPSAAFPAGENVSFLLSEKLFYWFSTGVLFGMVALALIYEGEFVLGLLKFGRGIESGVERRFGTVGRGIHDAERLVEKEVERDVTSGIDLITPEWSKKIQAKLAKTKKQEKQGGPAFKTKRGRQGKRV